MRPIALFIVSIFVATPAGARPAWLHAALPQPVPHAVDLSGATSFRSFRSVEDADMPLLTRSAPDAQSGGSILPHLGMEPSNAEFDGRGRKHHHMVTYGLDGFHPLGSNVSGSVGTRGGLIHFTWPSGN
jgi:hypothetical protein